MEVFRNVVGYEEFFSISNFGSLYSKRTNKVLKLHKSKAGYLTCSTRIGGRAGKCICFKIHRLVAEAFIDNRDNKPEVNHKDGNKINNNLDNLEWATPSENIQHAYNTGLIISLKGEEVSRAILTEEDVEAIKKLYVPKKFGRRRIAKKLNLPLGAVTNVCAERRWKHMK